MKTRRILSAILAVLMLLSIAVTGVSAKPVEMPFTDVKEGDWFYSNVSYAYSEGLMNGTGNGTTFSPMGKLTRGMVVTVLYRNAESPATSFKYLFADIVDSEKYYAKAAIWAYNNDIVTGTGFDEWGDPIFSPDRDITRQELATMFGRYAKAIHVDVTKKVADISSFPDSGKVASWAADTVKWAVGTGLITGKTSGGEAFLAPEDTATRAEFAAVIERFNKAEFEYNLYYNAPKPLSTYTEPDYPLVEDADIYVSTDGNDKNTGTKEKPLATFAGAKAKVRAMLASGVKGEIKVAFMAGVYAAPENLAFTAEDSGTAETPVTYCAYGDGAVEFNAGAILPLKDFIPVSNTEREMFPEETVDRIKKIDLAKYGVDVTKLSSSNDLFAGSDRLILSRWPNKHSNGSDTFSKDYDYVAEDESYIALRFDLVERLNGYHNIDDMYMFGYYRYDWSASDGKVISYDPETGKIVPTVNGYGIYNNQAEWDSGMPYFFFYNIPDELDTAEEYYIDKKTATLYVFDPKDDLVFSKTGQMITMTEADHISFVNLEFSYGTDGWVNAQNCDYITFDRCNVHNIRGKGIYITGDNIIVTACEFVDIGNRGVEMVSGDRETLTSGNSVIENCLFDRFGTITKTGAPAVYAWGCGTRIAHNEICNSTNIGIIYSEYIWASNDFVIEYNYIHDVLTQTSDSGAIYGGRNGAGNGTVIRYNIIDTTGNPVLGHFAVGIYLDDIMSGQEIYGNIIYGVTSDYIFVNGGRENKIHDNIMIVPEFYDKAMIQINQSQYTKVEGLTEGFTKPLTEWEELMIVELVPFRNEVWASRFPTLAKLTYGSDMAKYKDDINCLMNPSYNVVKDNVIFATDEVLKTSKVEEREQYAERVKLFSELEPCKTYSYAENPYFVNPTIGDYTMSGGADIADNHFAKIGRY